MQNRRLRVGPVALIGTLATNILNCAISSLAGPVGFTPTQPYILLTHLRAVNTTSGPLAISLFIGASATAAAGSEFAWSAYVIPANDYREWFGEVLLKSTDFLCGGSTTTGLTLEAEGEIGFAT